VSLDNSVMIWIGRLREGDRDAAQKLWEDYFQRLVGLARKKLQGVPRRMADEEDVAISAFDSFCQGVRGNRFPQLNDREDLWHLLVTITARKAVDLRHYASRKKRGGGVVHVEDADVAAGDDALMDQIVGREPTPEFAAQVAEECQRLLAALDDPELRSVALWKMEGYTNEEIAEGLACVPRTVERKLKLIRCLLWSQRDTP
jgi:DNA-directed RNA polymerase specialized sigma24 family protein